MSSNAGMLHDQPKPGGENLAMYKDLRFTPTDKVESMCLIESWRIFPHSSGNLQDIPFADFCDLAAASFASSPYSRDFQASQ